MARYQSRTIKGALYDKGANGSSSKLLYDMVTVTYPDLELLSETFRGVGINGEIDLPTYGQLGALAVEIAFNGQSKESIRLFAQQTQKLEHRWASQVLNSETGVSEVVGKKVIFHGLPKKMGIGAIEPNKAEEPTASFELTYMKYVIGNDVVFEIDKLNDKFVVNGTDYSESVRNVL